MLAVLKIRVLLPVSFIKRFINEKSKNPVPSVPTSAVGPSSQLLANIEQVGDYGNFTEISVLLFTSETCRAS